MKKVLVIGATGTIGSAVCKELSSDTDVISASFSRGGFQVDISQSDSIQQLYQKVGSVDAVVCAAARGVTFDRLPQMTLLDFQNSM